MSYIQILHKTRFWIEKILQNREILKDFWLPLLGSNSAKLRACGSRHELLRNSALCLALRAHRRLSGNETTGKREPKQKTTRFSLHS